MNNQELMEQFERCKEWQDAEQWEALAWQYIKRGYLLNAAYCFKQAVACQVLEAA